LNGSFPYQHQIETIRASGVKNILLIGPGDGLVPYYLKDVLGINVTTCDIDPKLNPDIVADVRKLPCADGEFEAVVIFEVLEHLPFADFPIALQEIARVSQGKVFVSLPYRNVAFEVLIKFPGIRTVLKRPWLHFIVKWPIKFLGFQYSKQHYWEIDTVTTKKVVEGVVSQFFDIKKRSHVVFDPYRYFINLEKKEAMSNTYAKEYYNSFLQKLPTDYKSARWFSSPAAKLDFDQTKLVLEKALSSWQSNSALEIGPGDGVWTDLIIPRTKKLTLLDQSVEMITRAKERLKDIPNITYIVSDFLAYNESASHDLVCAVRCFEYFEDKEKAMSQFSRLLKQGGRLVIVTKNPLHARMKEVQERGLHKGQIEKTQMHELLEKHGFTLESTLSATWRFKAQNGLMRALFRTFHYLHVKSGGAFMIPYLTSPLTESYIYVAKKR
jgi:ubiquinone/menaquinone biosynthesis C-methylase UbiE